jgi:acetyl-CoA C-acetyltransferase
MESLKDRIAIVGMGCTKFGERWDQSFEDLTIDAAYEALEDAGIGPTDVEAAWLGTQGAGLTGMQLSIPLKLPDIPVTRVENACSTGTDAIRNACFAVASGAYDMVLVVGVEKLKDSGIGGLFTGSGPYGGGFLKHPVIGVPHTAPGTFALMATRYFHTYGLTPEEGKRVLAKITVKNHHNGSMHPKAHLRKETTIEQVVNAPPVAWPLGLLDCCGVSDGAAAAILTRPEIAREMRDDYVLLKGLGLSSGKGMGRVLRSYDFVHVDENLAASRQAYDQAGISDPFTEIDVAEVHDCFTITELVIYEDLGFCPRGAANDYVETGKFTLEGALPVNSDGGLKCFGHPVGASGVRMIYEIYKQLQGKCDKRQVKDAEVGLTHNLGGGPGAGVCAVSIWGR